MSTRSCARGFTLIEVILLVAVVSAALVGVLLVFQNTVRGSADPQLRKQALAIAEAMMDEILLSPFDVVAGAGLPRANFNDIVDYNTYDSAPGGIVDILGNAVPGLASYNVAVSVTDVTLTNTAPPGPVLADVTEARRITVTVIGPANVAISLEGYRTRYAGP